jgi:hypothetical protein
LVLVVLVVLRLHQQAEVKALLQYFHQSLLLVVVLVQNGHPMVAMEVLEAVAVVAVRVPVELVFLEKVLLVAQILAVIVAVVAVAVQVLLE